MAVNDDIIRKNTAKILSVIMGVYGRSGDRARIEKRWQSCIAWQCTSDTRKEKIQNIKKTALISCRAADGFVLWRQSPWDLILQGFCGL